MSMPGWYSDPAGTPGQFRYWDGQSWSEQTSSDPHSTPPPAGSPNGSPSGKARRRGLVIGVIALALILVLTGFLVLRGMTGGGPITEPLPSSTVSGWDDSSPLPTASPTPSTSPTPTPSPSPEPSAPIIACPTGDPTYRTQYPSDDRVHGGGISFGNVDGWRDSSYSSAMSWAYDVGALDKPVQDTWFALLAVGQLRIIDGFEQPKQSAESVMQCVASSGYYPGFTGRKELSSKQITVDGKAAWSMRTEILVDARIDLAGDVVEVIIVDTGNPEGLSMFVGAVPIGDDDLIGVLDQTVADLQVG